MQITSVKPFRTSVFVYQGKTFNIGASIGVVQINAEINDIHTALSKADSACYMAKEKGRSRVHTYRADDKELIQRHGEMDIVSRINTALDEDGFELFFQTIKPLSDSAPHGDHYEILIRLQDPKGSWVAPGFFLPAAERYNIVHKVDRWVVRKLFS